MIKKYKDSELSTDEIIKEVCKEYNINYDYINSSKFDRKVTNISKVLAKYIRDIIKIVRKNIYNKNLQSILEILVKILIYILLVVFIKLPFILIEGLYKFVNKMLFYPFNNTINTSCNILSSIIYLLMCITLLVKVFGNSKIIEKKKVDEKIIKEVDTDYKWLDFIIRLVIYSLILIPLGVLFIIALALLAVVLYLVFTGVKIEGIAILLIGIILLLNVVVKIIRDSLNHKNKFRVTSLYISSLVFIIGVLISIYNINNFESPNTLEDSVVKPITEELDVKLDNPSTKIYLKKGNYELITNDNLEGNNIKVEITYYDDYVDVLYGQEKNGDDNYLLFRTKSDDKIDNKLIIENIYKDLKNGYIFNYSNVNNINIKIYGNSEIIKKLEEINK